MESLSNIIYPKQYIFFESDDKKIFKIIKDIENAKPVDEYLWSPITTISEKIVKGVKYSLIQYEDERLGWVHLDQSIQIFRNKPISYKFIDQEFENHEINIKMGNNKDYRTQFDKKLLSVKSEIEYNGEILLGVFIKDKFSGFHPTKYFEKNIECEIDIPVDIMKTKNLYKISTLEKPTKQNVEYKHPKIITFYRNNNLCRVKVNDKEFYWTTLDGLEGFIDNVTSNEAYRTSEEKIYDDIEYAIYQERQQSKEIMKTVLDAQNYIKTKKDRERIFRIKTLESSFKNAKVRNENYSEQIEKLKNEVKVLKESAINNGTPKIVTDEASTNSVSNDKQLKNEILELKRKNRELDQSVKLNEKRLAHQKDYNERLEAQKSKYKNRMEIVEEKLKNLQEKNKS